MSDITVLTCCECGIVFGLSKDVEEHWRKSHKTFYCPNGHGQAWNGPTEKDKELESLRTEVKELKDKLKSALEDVEKQTKRADALVLELEIWRPASQDESSVLPKSTEKVS